MSVNSHVTPVLPLAAAAVRGGHEVLFATGAETLSVPRSAGFDAVKAGLSYTEIQERLSTTGSIGTLAKLSVHDRFVRIVVTIALEIAADPMVKDLLPLVEEWKPDVIVSTMIEVGGRIAAVAHGVPHVMHSFGPPKTRVGLEEYERGLAEVERRWGMPEETIAAFQDEPYLDIWPASLSQNIPADYYPNAWPMRPEQTQPYSERPVRPAILDGLPYPKTVYITTGTTWKFPDALSTMVAAARELSVNVIATTGPDIDPALLGPQPDHVRVERFVPQRDLLPYCDAVLAHGGAGTVLGALGHGLPQVCVPLTTDHHESAASVESSGAGLACDSENQSIDDIRDALVRVLEEPRFREAASRVGREIAAMPSPEELVARLADYAKTSADR
jgi:UDP:flavonoid glycosyltransferase YjiC (YdhE family)